MKIRLLWFVPLLFSSGCVLETAQPLSDPMTAKPDDLMLGRWLVKADGKDRIDDIYIFIGKHSTRGNPESIMEYGDVVWNPREFKMALGKPMFFTVTRIGQTSYLNLFFLEKKGMGEQIPDLLLPGSYQQYAGDPKRYTAIFRYFCDGKKLQLWNIDKKQNLQDKFVKNKLLDVVGNRVTLDSLEKYLRKHGGDVLFDSLVFEAQKLP